MTTIEPEQPDETAQDPDEETLPPKPPIEDQLPEEGIDPWPDDEEEDVPDDAYLDSTAARDDDTVDDQEDDEETEP